MGVKVREKPPGSGVYWIFINHQGKRKSKKVGDEKTAWKAAKKIEAKLTLEDLSLLEKERSIPSFNVYCQLWLDDYVKQTKRATTYQRYKGFFKNYLEKPIGDLSLDQIKRSNIRNIMLSLHKKGLSKSSLSTARNVISGTFEYAIDDELVTYNPTAGILRKLGLDSRKDRETVQTMIPDEVSLFLATCQKYERKWYPLYLCAFRTGMRLGEFLGLHWGDIDWNGKFILVQRSFRHGMITKTKTGRARRVDMSDQLFRELQALYTIRKREALRDGLGEVVEIIFHTKGEYTSQNSIRNIWKRMLRKAKLRDMRLHIIRHTYASILLSKGKSPVYVKDQLGHASIQMTVDIYGHLIPNSNRDAVNELDEIAPIRTLSAPSKNEKAATH